MGWSYIGQFTGKWSISRLPAAALDDSGNVWVMWGNGPEMDLRWFKQSLPPETGAVAVVPTLTPRSTQGSPCLVPLPGQLLALYRGGDNDQGIHLWPMLRGVPNAELINGANTADGPTAAYIDDTGSVFVTWRGSESSPGNGDTTFWYSNISAPQTAPNAAAAQSFNQPGFMSYYSPSVAPMPGGGFAACWKGVAPPANGDNRMWFSTVPSSNSQAWTPSSPPGIVVFSVPGGFTTPLVTNRPSLARVTSQKEDKLVLVYSSVSGDLGYLLGSVDENGLNWSVPQQAGDVPWKVPLEILPVPKPANPIAVWVATHRANEPRYLLVADQQGGTIGGPLYVLAFTFD